MSNPFYGVLGGQNALPGNMNNLINRFKQFKRTFSGDPRQQIQQMLNSGQITQEQYNNAAQMATQLQRVLGVL